MTPETLRWRTPSRCGTGASCVAVAFNGGNGNVAVRSTTEPRTVSVFTATEWADFIAAVKRGEFDRWEVTP